MKKVIAIGLLISSLYGATFEEWLDGFKKEALTLGINQSTIDKAFVDTKFLQKNIDLDRNQPHKKLTYQEYMQKVITKQRIDNGKQKLKDYNKLLTKVSKKYKIDKNVIVALWGVETSYGKITGKHNIIDSLATLAYDGRRAEFFKKELINALKIMQSQHIEKKNFVGSWAGAMGQCQFMPSSYLAYAKDFNKDKKVDIWATQSDVFASIANYLASNGFKHNQPIVAKVRLSQPLDDSMFSKDVVKSLVEWQKLGIYPIDMINENLDGYLSYADDTKQEVYLHFSNYKVISHWNKSKYFVYSVSFLAENFDK